MIGGRGESGEVEWRRWLQRGTEQRRREGAAEKEEVREAKVLEGEGEGKKSLGLVALRSEEGGGGDGAALEASTQEKDKPKT